MARKANQPKNGLNSNTSNKKGVVQSGCGFPTTVGSNNLNDVNVFASESSCGNQENSPLIGNIKGIASGDGRKKNKKSGMSGKIGDEEVVAMQSPYRSIDGKSEVVEAISSTMDGISRDGTHDRECLDHDLEGESNGSSREDVIKYAHFYYLLLLQSAKAFAFSFGKTVSAWVERHQPFINDLANRMRRGRDCIHMRFLLMYPVALRWLVNVGNVILIVLVLWLDSSFRGMGSILHMGTSSFFLVIWCSMLSSVMMIGMTKSLLVLAVAALVGFFVSFITAVLFVVASGALILWLYGSFWMTSLVVCLGGLAFALSHGYLALLIGTVYSVYSAWMYAGWRGTFLALNLAFISGDALKYFLQSKIDESRNTESAQSAGVQDQPHFSDNESHHPYPKNGSRQSADRSGGVASTSGADNEVSSEAEVF